MAHDPPSKALAAIVLAAGRGKRMASPLAKVLHPLGGRPLIRHVVESARRLGARPIAVVLGHQADSVRAVFAGDDEDLKFPLQAEQLGTGHATAIGISAIGDRRGDVLVLCGDVPLLRAETLADLLAFHRSADAAATVLTAVMDDPAGYGRIVRREGPEGKIVAVREDADATGEERAIREVNTGTYVFDLDFLSRTLPRIRAENEQNEYYLPDVLPLALEEGLPVTAMVAPNSQEAMGVNRPDDLALAESLWSARMDISPDPPNRR